MLQSFFTKPFFRMAVMHKQGYLLVVLLAALAARHKAVGLSLRPIPFLDRFFQTAANKDVGNKDFHELLLTRRTVNDFEPELPPGWEDAVYRAIEAATYAPNHKRTEPWRFHLLGPDAVRRVCELNAELVSSKKGPEAGAKKLKRWLDIPGKQPLSCRNAYLQHKDAMVVLNLALTN